MRALLFCGFALLAHSALGQTVSLTTSYPHAYPYFFVGDAWVLAISGAAPSSLIEVSATLNGSSLGTTPFGYTDGSGNRGFGGTLDSSTVGTWVEDVYVGGDFIGELDFTVSAPTSCSYADSGAAWLYSTDVYVAGYFGWVYPGSATVYHDIYGGPCNFTASSGGYGSWIASSYTASSTEIVWTVDDVGGPTEDPGGCPRCDPYNFYGGSYPVISYATLSSNVYNSQANTVQVLNTTVTLWVDWVYYY